MSSQCINYQCEECDRNRGCECSEAKTITDLCVHCKTRKAYEQIQRTQELNRKLKEMGASYEPPALKQKPAEAGEDE